MTGDRRQSTDEIRCPSSGYCHLKVGFPIRKSADQSSFAAPRGFSQRSTSFIASQRQGIHQMPLVHLITLIINAQTALGSTDPDLSFEARTGGTLIRKNSLQDRTDNPLRSSKRLTKHLHETPCGTTRTCRECVPAAIFRSRSILGTI